MVCTNVLASLVQNPNIIDEVLRPVVRLNEALARLVFFNGDCVVNAAIQDMLQSLNGCLRASAY